MLKPIVNKDVKLDSLEVLLEECRAKHFHICPGQVLGVRMALLGCRLIGISEPRTQQRKKIVVWVEIDRCMSDAVSIVTGVSLGRRTLKYMDYGKAAASFLNIETGAAVRIVALESARHLSEVRHPELGDKKARQLKTYKEAFDEDLFKLESIKVSLNRFEWPGPPLVRVICENCNESVADSREITLSNGAKFCRPCFEGAYYQLHGT